MNSSDLGVPGASGHIVRSYSERSNQWFLRRHSVVQAHFSPGVIDGTWGKNAAQAFSFFRSSAQVDSGSAGRHSDSATIDKNSYEQLLAAGGSAPVVTSYTVTVDLTKVASGTSLTVPNVADSVGNATGQVAKLIISKTGFWTNAVDASGRVLYHFPSTLGAGYDPSPTGDFHITGVAHNPTFHYQPTLFAEVPDSKPTARLPAGPNSPVGVAWMALSKPHYGIHGTPEPEAIGYASSHGCVRLTNWDAERLSKLVRPGVAVAFVD